LINKKTILIIENSIDVTGALKSITRSCLYNTSDYHFIFVLPKRSTAGHWLRQQGFAHIEYINMSELSRSWKRNIMYLPLLLVNALSLKRIVRQHKVDLIINNDLYNLLPVVLRFIGCSIRYICYVRFLPNRFPFILYNFWLKLHLFHAFAIVAVSKHLAGFLPESSKVHVIYNELPIESGVHNLSLDVERESIFLYLSNYIRGKGHEYALQAFSKITHQIPDWKLRFVGGDMGLTKNRIYVEELKALSISLHIEEKCEWHGFTNNIQEEYKRVEIALNFSESESFSLTCLEAIYFGTPVIATKSGGPVEIVSHGVTGLLVENSNINEMAKAMLKLANNSEWRKTVNVMGAAIVQEKFSPGKTSGKLFKLLVEALRK
jgi:glycosyltransferase involved in cell wall biosynthesis